MQRPFFVRAAVAHTHLEEENSHFQALRMAFARSSCALIIALRVVVVMGASIMGRSFLISVSELRSICHFENISTNETSPSFRQDLLKYP